MNLFVMCLIATLSIKVFAIEDEITESINTSTPNTTQFQISLNSTLQKVLDEHGRIAPEGRNVGNGFFNGLLSLFMPNYNKVPKCNVKNLKNTISKLKRILHMCQATDPSIGFTECVKQQEMLYMKRKNLQIKLMTCREELDIHYSNLFSVQESTATCEGFNRILSPQLSDLNIKFSIMTNLQSRHQNEFNECRRVYNRCRELERRCDEQC